MATANAARAASAKKAPVRRPTIRRRFTRSPSCSSRFLQPTRPRRHPPPTSSQGWRRRGPPSRTTSHAELNKAGHDMPRVIAANEKYHADSSAWAKRASALLKAHPAEPAALDVILAMNQIHYVDDETVAILREHHFANPKVLTLLNSFSQDSPGPRRQFAEDLADKHPDRSRPCQGDAGAGTNGPNLPYRRLEEKPQLRRPARDVRRVARAGRSLSPARGKRLRRYKIRRGGRDARRAGQGRTGGARQRRAARGRERGAGHRVRGPGCKAAEAERSGAAK